MKTLHMVQSDLAAGRFAFSRHALRRAIERNISEAELRELSVNLEVIEVYPDDKYSPSALLLGFTKCGRALHLQVSLSEVTETKIITLYEPSPSEWINHRQRRGPHV